MTKHELSLRITERTGIQCSQVQRVLDAFIVETRETLAQRESIFLRGFGTLRTVVRQPKKARDMRTNATINVPARLAVQLKPCKEFKNMLPHETL